MAKVAKTNAMRLLDKSNLDYKIHSYNNDDGKIDGLSVAKKLGIDVKNVYKTLVTQGLSKEYYVFVIPVEKELDLKSAAKAVNEKSVEMINVKDINNVTGYIRGGCSPIGMKKQYPTIIDIPCNELDTIIISAGKIGYQIEIAPKELIKLIDYKLASIVH